MAHLGHARSARMTQGRGVYRPTRPLRSSHRGKRFPLPRESWVVESRTVSVTRRGLGLLLLVLLVALAGLSVLAPSAQADWPGPGPQINSGNGDHPAIADIGGEPWVAYGEGPQGEDSAILVKRLVGGVWTAVGGPL